MNERERCPLCNHDMDEHTYQDDDGRLWLLFWCDSCQCEFAAIGFDEFVALIAPASEGHDAQA